MIVAVGRAGGRYRLLEPPVAAGGQSVVYRAVALDDERVVALRHARPGPAGADVAEEAAWIERLGADPILGPLVAPVWDAGLLEGRPFVVRDWYACTLADLQTLPERLRALRALAGRVEALGAHGVVHGDLTPHNVLLRDADPDAPAMADFGVIPGRPVRFSRGYAPPEQVSGGAPGPAWDRYALACTAFRVLAGAAPEGPVRGAGLIRTDRKLFLRRVPGGRLIVRAIGAHLHPDPARRPGDLAELILALSIPPRRRVPVTTGGAGALVALAVGAVFLRGPPPCPPGYTGDGAVCVGADGGRIVYVPPGVFLQGALDDARPEWTVDAPRHLVVLTTARWVSATEVTQREWAELMDEDVMSRTQVFPSGLTTPCARWLDRSLVDPEAPVVCVSFYDAIAYANARSVRDGLRPVYVLAGGRVRWDRSADGWRLPTEAEWEWAMRAGTSTPWVSAPSRDAVCAWANVRDAGALEKWHHEVACDDGYPLLAPVGRLRPNPAGLFDGLGNVLEWVWDPYGPYPSGVAVDPAGAGADASSRVLRGGSWNHIARGVDARYAEPPDGFVHSIGFRVVRDAPFRFGGW